MVTFLVVCFFVVFFATFSMDDQGSSCIFIVSPATTIFIRL